MHYVLKKEFIPAHYPVLGLLLTDFLKAK
jgi:hypothetical protein